MAKSKEQEAFSSGEKLFERLLKDESYSSLIKYYLEKKSELNLEDAGTEKAAQFQVVEDILERRLSEDSKYRKAFAEFSEKEIKTGKETYEKLMGPAQPGRDYVGGSPGGSPVAILMALGSRVPGVRNLLSKKSGAISNARGFGQLTKGSKTATTAAKEGGKLNKVGVLGGSILGSVLISKGGDVITKRMGLSDQQLAFEEDARKQEKLENVAFNSELIRDAGIPADEAKIAAREEFAARNEMFRIKAELANQHMNRVQTAMGGIRSIAPNMQQPPSTFLELAGAITRDVETTMPDRAAFTTPPG